MRQANFVTTLMLFLVSPILAEDVFAPKADVKVNSVDTFNRPASAPIFSEFSALKDKSDATEFEDVLFVGHNTRAWVVDTRTFAVGDKTANAVLVNFRTGPLRSQRYWINEASLRLETQPDPSVNRREPTAPSIEVPERITSPEANRESSKKKVSSAKEAPVYALVLTDVSATQSLSGNFINVDGRLKNTSDGTLTGLEAKAIFEGPDGELLFSETAPVELFDLESSDVGTFKVITRAKQDYDQIRIQLTAKGESVKWLDKTGKRVHP